MTLKIKVKHGPGIPPLPGETGRLTVITDDPPGSGNSMHRFSQTCLDFVQSLEIDYVVSFVQDGNDYILTVK